MSETRLEIKGGKELYDDSPNTFVLELVTGCWSRIANAHLSLNQAKPHRFRDAEK